MYVSLAFVRREAPGRICLTKCQRRECEIPDRYREVGNQYWPNGIGIDSVLRIDCTLGSNYSDPDQTRPTNGSVWVHLFEPTVWSSSMRNEPGPDRWVIQVNFIRIII